MNGFKLIAIRPLEGCSKRVLKVLKENKVYKFYNDYHFSFVDNDEGKSVETIEYKPSVPNDLYQIKILRRQRLDINISSVVGKNGSGKSTILELFYLAIYILSIEEEILPDSLRKIDENIDKIQRNPNRSLGDLNKSHLEYLIKKKEEVKELLSSIKFEIYYCIEEKIYSLIYNPSSKNTRNISIIPFLKNNSNIYINQKIPVEFNSKIFFYSVIMNYSIYGLNSLQMGTWIQSLFHKNDGYKTPLVINPMRTEGNYDINTETHLCQSRILFNLVDSKLTVKSLLENKNVDKIEFKYNLKKIEAYRDISLKNIYDNFNRKYNLSLQDVFVKTYNAFMHDDIWNNDKETLHFEIINKYIFKKLLKIASTYEKYNRFYSISKDKLPIPEIIDFDDYLNLLKDDHSHITLKIRQVFNIVRYNLLREEKDIEWIDNVITIPLNVLIKRIQKIKLSEKENVLEYMPAAFFNPEFLIKGESKYYSMSSGEQQVVNAIQSVLYHLQNINSVFEDSQKNTFKYHYVNICFDEIELYFHPDLQRKFIKELLESIKRLRLKNIKGLNILFSTHSPYILSDIPSANTLRLEEGEPRSKEILPETFGANIHNLLAKNFFMKDGFMGEFAKNKIEETISYLNEVKKIKEKINVAIDEDRSDTNIEKYKELKSKREFYKYIIELIGEPVIKNKLTQMYRDVFEDEKKKQFEDLARELNAEINYREN